ncbi:MAG: hypothetical protein AAF471_03120 [Myxococcota bacterium]
MDPLTQSQQIVAEMQQHLWQSCKSSKVSNAWPELCARDLGPVGGPTAGEEPNEPLVKAITTAAFEKNNTVPRLTVHLDPRQLPEPIGPLVREILRQDPAGKILLSQEAVVGTRESVKSMTIVDSQGRGRFAWMFSETGWQVVWEHAPTAADPLFARLANSRESPHTSDECDFFLEKEKLGPDESEIMLGQWIPQIKVPVRIAWQVEQGRRQVTLTQAKGTNQPLSQKLATYRSQQVADGPADSTREEGLLQQERDNHRQTKQERDRLTGEKEDLTDETARLTGEITSLTEQTNSLDSQNQTLRDDVARLRDAREELETNFTLVRDRNRQLGTERGLERRQRMQDNQAALQRTMRLQAELTQAQNDNDRLSENYNELASENFTYGAENADLASQIDELEEERDRLRRGLEQTLVQNRSLETDRDNIRGALRGLERKQPGLESKLTQAQNKVRELTGKNNEIQSALRKLKLKQSMLEQELPSLRRERDKLAKTLNDVKKELHTNDNKAVPYVAKSTKKERDRLRGYLARIKTKLGLKESVRNQEIVDKVEQLRDSLDKIKQNLGNGKLIDSQVANTVKTKIASLRTQLNKANDQNQQLTAKSKDFDDERKQLTNQLGDLTGQINSLTAQNQTLRQNWNNEQQRANDLNQHMVWGGQREDNLQEEINVLEEEAERLRQELVEERFGAGVTSARLASALDQTLAQNRRLQGKLSHALQKQEEFKKEINYWFYKYKKLDEHFDDATDEKEGTNNLVEKESKMFFSYLYNVIESERLLKINKNYKRITGSTRDKNCIKKYEEAISFISLFEGNEDKKEAFKNLETIYHVMKEKYKKENKYHIDNIMQLIGIIRKTHFGDCFFDEENFAESLP